MRSGSTIASIATILPSATVKPRTASFDEIHLDYQAWINPQEPRRWEHIFRSSGNTTLEEAVNQTLSPSEAEEFVAYLRPRIEVGEGWEREAVAYLWGIRH